MSDDSFERQSTPIAGLSDLLDKFSARLAAASDMPRVLTCDELAREGAPLVMRARGFRCLNLGCPERSPVRASEPPTCYTCARPMAEVHAPVTQEEVASLPRTPLRLAPTPGYTAYASEHPLYDRLDIARRHLPGEREARQAAKNISFADACARSQSRRRGDEASAEAALALIRSLPERAFPYGYDVADEPRPGGRWWAIDGKFGVGDRVSVGRSVDVSYCCTRPGCPQRSPAHAATAPTCYTCQQPMTAIAVPHGDGVGGALAFYTHNPSASAAIPGHVLNGQRCLPEWNVVHDLRWLGDHAQVKAAAKTRWAEAAAKPRWVFDGDCPEWGEQYKPVGHPVTLDGEPITVLNGYYGESPRLIVPREDLSFWLGLAARKVPHTIEWAGYLAEFQVIGAVQANRNRIEIRFVRARSNVLPEEILPTIRDVSKDPRERLAAAENLLMDLPSGPQFAELATELRSMRESAPLLDDPLVGPVQADWQMIFPGVWQTARASTVVGIDGRCVHVTMLEVRRNRSAASMTMRMDRSDAERLRGTRPTIETSSGTWERLRVGGIVDTLTPGRVAVYLYSEGRP